MTQHPGILGVTGNLGTGKSTFSNKISTKLKAAHFSSDSRVQDLLHNDPIVEEQIRSAFGEDAYLREGRPNKPYLRRMIFADARLRKTLETILHPRVRSTYVELIDSCRAERRGAIIEIPLLFETGAEKFFDAVICVACTEGVQLGRLETFRSIQRKEAKKMIATQWPIEQKCELSHHVVWNDGSLTALEMQIDYLSCLFTHA